MRLHYLKDILQLILKAEWEIIDWPPKRSGLGAIVFTYYSPTKEDWEDVNGIPFTRVPLFLA